MVYTIRTSRSFIRVCTTRPVQLGGLASRWRRQTLIDCPTAIFAHGNLPKPFCVSHRGNGNRSAVDGPVYYYYYYWLFISFYLRAYRYVTAVYRRQYIRISNAIKFNNNNYIRRADIGMCVWGGGHLPAYLHVRTYLCYYCTVTQSRTASRVAVAAYACTPDSA